MIDLDIGKIKAITSWNVHRTFKDGFCDFNGIKDLCTDDIVFLTSNDAMAAYQKGMPFTIAKEKLLAKKADIKRTEKKENDVNGIDDRNKNDKKPWTEIISTPSQSHIPQNRFN